MEMIQKVNAAKWQEMKKWIADMDHVVIDTCVFMSDIEPFFLRVQALAPKMQAAKYPGGGDKLIYIPESCVVELFSKAQNRSGKENPETVRQGKSGLERLKALMDLDVVKVLEDNALGAFGDGAILSVASQANSRKRLGFITLDAALARDLVGLRSLESMHTHHSVRTVDFSGYLRMVETDRRPAPTPVSRPRKRGSIHCYSCQGELPKEENRILNSCGIPEKGDVLYKTDGTAVTLGEQIDTGGKEAAVMEVAGDEELCAKVLLYPTARKQAKVELLCSRAFELDGVIFPDEPLYSEEGVFRGYIMKRLKNVVPMKPLFYGHRAVRNWDRRSFAQLGVTIAKILYSVHVKGILLSDISDTNILVGLDEQGNAVPDKVYIIDTDSAQLGAKGGPVYPADGLNPCYTCREDHAAQWKNTMLRSYQSELFSCATIVAQALMCIHPFRGKDASGESGSREAEIIANIKSGVFSYGTSEHRKSAGYTAPGLGAYLWSHLPSSAKTFIRSALTCAPENRPSVKELIRVAESCLAYFSDDEAAERFPQLRSVTPTMFKPYWVTCEDCGKVYDAANRGVSRNEHFLCEECASKEVAWCAACGEPTLTAGERLLGRSAHKYCRSCWEKELQRRGDSFSHYAGCSECGRTFEVMRSEAANPPVKCPACRKKEGSSAAEPSSAPSASAAHESTWMKWLKQFGKGA